MRVFESEGAYRRNVIDSGDTFDRYPERDTMFAISSYVSELMAKDGDRKLLEFPGLGTRDEIADCIIERHRSVDSNRKSDR